MAENVNLLIKRYRPVLVLTLMQMPENHEQYKDTIRNIRILVAGLMVALVIGVVGLGMGMRTIHDQVRDKDIQLHSMAEEIGQLKEENYYLYQHIVENRGIVHETLAGFEEAFLGTIANDQEKQEALRNQFAQVKRSLMDTLSEKEQSLHELQQKNNALVQEASIPNQPDEIVTVLILGEHDLLTDTIIIAAINPENKTISLVSIPRDLYVNGRKINSVYAAYGIEKIKHDLGMVTGLTFDHYVVFNMEAFKQTIDILDGIDIYVRETIRDPYFPTANNGYREYVVEEGSHHMTGEEALMYARSRKTTSDFDRSKRQQQIVQALRVKIKLLNILDDIDKAIDLYGVVKQYVQTDIDVFEALHYLSRYQNYAIESGNVISTDNVLYASRAINGQYILLPKSGNYGDIQRSISTLIKK
ncbi:hypothetical protein GF369_03760 [Candidatus Peregrinibacteria bacterium]|nr:hypothetical protein [Candidatus Peregrinibacteria bacterium]